MNRADYLDPALCWTGVKETGKGGSLSEVGYANLNVRDIAAALAAAPSSS
mgnify:CR=1 FL=1